MDKKFLMLIVMGILFLSMFSVVSAVSKSYNEDTQTVKLKKTFLYIPIGDLAEVQLKTPLVNYVNDGDEVMVIEYNITGRDDLDNDFFGQIKTYNKKIFDKGIETELNKKFIWKYVEKYQEEEPVYSYKEVTDANGTYIKKVQVGSNLVNKEREVLYDPAVKKIKKDESLTIRGYTDIHQGDNIEFIPQFADVKIDEWASIVSTNGAVTTDGDYTIVTFTANGYFNITGDMLNAWVLIIGGGGSGGPTGSYTGGGGSGEALNGTMNITAGNYLVNVGKGGVYGVSLAGNSSFNGAVAWGGGNGQDYNQVGNNGGSASGGSGANSGGQVGGTSLTGTLAGLTHYGNNGGTGAGHSGGGGGGCGTAGSNAVENGGNGLGGDGVIFNINGTAFEYCGGGTGSIWEFGDYSANIPGGAGERAISSTPGTKGWANTGSGSGGVNEGADGVIIIRYLTPLLGPTVTLYSPENTTNSTNQTINFIGNISKTSSLINVSLIVDDIYVETNTSGVLGNYSFIDTLSDGDHFWTLEACDDDGCVNASQRTLSINTTPFIEFLTPPTLPNYANITDETIPIGVNVSTNYFFNITYSLRNINGTEFQQYYETETYEYNFTNIPDGHYHYDVTICTTTGKCNVTEIRHINHDVSPPEINVTSPTGTYTYLYNGETLDLNLTVADELANVSSCWFNYNGTNNSIPCINGTLISIPFILQSNKNNLTVYTNDTFGNLGSEFVSWNYKIFETQKEYNNETLEGNLETFKLYLKKGSGVNVQNVVLHYDGQTDTSSLFSSGSDVMAESDLFINNVVADTNNTFYFTVTLADSTVFNTTSAVQLVKNIALDDCSSQPNLFLKLNLVDEENQSAISGDIQVYLSIINPDNLQEVLNFNSSYSSVSTKSFCSNILLNESSFLLGAEIRYNSENHSAEFYNIQRSNLSLYPKEYILYDLKSDDSTKFKLVYRGENLIGVEGAIIQLQRKYISEGVYKIVEAPLTSSESTAVVHIDTNTNSYKATVVKDGVLLNTFDNLVFICQSELTGECVLDLQDFLVPPNSVSIESIQDFSYTITSSIDDKKITVDYSVPSGTTSNIRVVATQQDIIGTETICNTSVSSAGGSIDCTYDESIQDSYISYNIYKDEVQIAQKSYIVKDDLRDDFGGDNYFILIIFTISLVFMALLSPEWIVINAIISVIIGGATWLIRGMDFVLGLGAIAWLLLGAVIIIIKMSQKEDQ